MPSSNRRTPKLMLLAGWVVSLLPILFFGVMPPVMYFLHRDMIQQGTDRVQFPAKYVPGIVALEVFCAVVYAIPQTALLGAILLTGFLGGAVASHVRLEQQQFFVPVIAGMIPWIGLWLRDARVRDLIPFRK